MKYLAIKEEKNPETVTILQDYSKLKSKDSTLSEKKYTEDFHVPAGQEQRPDYSLPGTHWSYSGGPSGQRTPTTLAAFAMKPCITSTCAGMHA